MSKIFLLVLLTVFFFPGSTSTERRQQPFASTTDIVLCYLPLIMHGYEPLAGLPTLNPINNPGGGSNYGISWSSVINVTKYVLEEDTSITFPSPITVYEGLNTSTNVTATSAGTYYYRVKGVYASTSTAWSNTQTVTVTSSPFTCPTSGIWSGSGYRFVINYQVVQDGNQCKIRSFSGHLTATCHIPQGSTWTKYVQYAAQDVITTGSHFETSGNNIQIKGDFLSTTSAQGTVFYSDWEPGSNTTCSLSTTWTAKLP